MNPTHPLLFCNRCYLTRPYVNKPLSIATSNLDILLPNPTIPCLPACPSHQASSPFPTRPLLPPCLIYPAIIVLVLGVIKILLQEVLVYAYQLFPVLGHVLELVEMQWEIVGGRIGQGALILGRKLGLEFCLPNFDVIVFSAGLFVGF